MGTIEEREGAPDFVGPARWPGGVARTDAESAGSPSFPTKAPRSEQLKTVLAEVAVEGEGVGDGFFTHDDETAGVDEADGLTTGTEHVSFGGSELGFGDVVEVDERKQFAVEARDIGESEASLN